MKADEGWYHAGEVACGIEMPEPAGLLKGHQIIGVVTRARELDLTRKH